MTEQIRNFIEGLKKKSQQIAKFDETETKQGIILPVFQHLGWDVWDTEKVKPEYPVEGKKAAAGGKVDYCLRIKRKSEVFLEAKRPGEDLERHQEQLLEYSFREGVDLAVLSNGVLWWFYLPLKKGRWKEKKIYAIDIMQQDTDEIAEKFNQLLSRDNIESGEALQNANNIYEQLDRQKKINETLPKAWNKLISSEEPRLFELLAETTESICGFRPDNDNVSNLLSIHKQKLLLPEIPIPKAEKTGERVKPLSKYEEHNMEFFQQILLKDKSGLNFDDKNLKKNWLNTFVDKLGMRYSYVIYTKGGRVDINNWYDDRDRYIFDKLIHDKENIENELGYSLEWDRNDKKQNWQIFKKYEEGGRDILESWPTLQDQMVNAMARFAKVFGPRLEAIYKLKAES